MNFQHFSTLFLIAIFMTFLPDTQAQSYQSPNPALADLIDAPNPPGTSLSPDDQYLLLMHRPNLPSIEEVAQPELRLAGLRINPRNNGPSRSYSYNKLEIQSVNQPDQIQAVRGLPANPRIENVSWSPSGKNIGFTISVEKGMELWVLNVANGKAKRLGNTYVNDAIGGLPFRWLDDQNMIYKAISSNPEQALCEARKSYPEEDLVPQGPVVQENIGKKAPVRTYQDLLQNPHDEDVFSYYVASQLMKIDTDGNSQKFAESGLIRNFNTSPDGQYVMVERLEKPFSYIVPYSRFPYTVDMYTRDGNHQAQIASIPLTEDIPKGFGATRTGPRSFQWRADQPATLVWVEALDGGDPATEVEYRDQMFTLAAPFEGKAQAGVQFKLRFGGFQWGNENLAMTFEFWRKTRQVIVSKFDPADLETGKTTIFDYSYEDRYNDPGDFQTHTNKYGRRVLLMDKKGKSLYLTGQGASPEGNRPFVDKYDLKDGSTERLWRSEAPYYESPLAILNPDKQVIITGRESQDEPRNLFIRDLKKGEMNAITNFGHPYPQMKDVSKELIRYERKDGVPLTGTLYLPPNYDKEKDGPLPVLLWAYPREYKSNKAAGQVSGSPHRFTRVSWASPTLWVMRGYAVLDGAAMPIVGQGDEEPNDKFREQLVANAEAAIDKLVEMGVGDRERIAVGGHSYGAFMTANLLAHSDLFAAGIARSGAYNRTLTPFGFQAEERTFWEAKDIYLSMSPFTYADKIKEPLLMIHGEADNNSGTFPMQSKRFYSALKGHGATVRLVMLPHESHGYRARESIMHMLWEMDSWLEKFVKNKSELENR
jgi:dipeptidyl aminopeptidase/acylaminoacyl peptidase